MTNLEDLLVEAIMAGDTIRTAELMREIDRAVYTVDAETTAALIADAQEAERAFLADIARMDAEYARRNRLDLRPGQRIGR